jgi:hypothetical protein
MSVPAACASPVLLGQPGSRAGLGDDTQEYADAEEQIPGRYFLAFLACRFSFSVFSAGFFSMLFLVFLSLVAMS